MSSPFSTPAPGAGARPRLRGVLHQYAFFVSLGVGTALVAVQDPLRRQVAAAVFAATTAAMFGTSALYNRVTWSPKWRQRMRRLDHTTIFLLIAGSYTAVALLVLSGTWRVAVLAVVWSGVLAAVVVSLVLPQAPKWVAAGIGVGLGWVGVIAFPKLLERVGPGAWPWLLRLAFSIRPGRWSTRAVGPIRSQPCSATTISSTRS